MASFFEAVKVVTSVQAGVIMFIVMAIVTLVLIRVRYMLAYRRFTSYGIKGPSPQMYFGNAKQIVKSGFNDFVADSVKKYGPIFGYYNGVKPYLLITDLDILREIMVKEFDVFMDREYSPNILRAETNSKAKGFFESRGEEWLRLRRILSKSFNTINLKKMSVSISQSCDNLCDKMAEYCDKQTSVDVWKLYGLYTMEVILGGGFGHQVQVINGEEDELTRVAADVFAASRGSGGVSLVTTFLSNFPFMLWYIRRQAVRSKAGQSYLVVEEKVEELVRKRQGSSCECQDLLQLLMDARAESDDEGEEDVPIAQRKLNRVEIVRTAISFLLAGYETTNNALAYTTYLLATHPSQQAKLCIEIDQYFNQHKDASLYDAAHGITYLDMVLQESLRMYPPAPRTTRYCSKTITINGVTIPEGTNVVVPIHAIHHSTQNWEEPNVFNPNRFSSESRSNRHAMAHMPFGWGRRSCVGMRLALMEAKMALVAIYRQFKLVEGPDTEKPLKTSIGITMIPVNGVYVRVQSRK